jgi:hypothetical protein
MTSKSEYIERLKIIRPKIRYGDYARIAALCGFSADYVKRVLSLNDRRFNLDILEHSERYYHSLDKLEASASIT